MAALESLVSEMLGQSLAKEDIRLRLLQVAFAYGTATLIYSLAPARVPRLLALAIVMPLVVVLGLVHYRLRRGLEESINKVTSSLVRDVFVSEDGAVSFIKKVEEFVRGVTLEDRNFLDDLILGKSPPGLRDVFYRIVSAVGIGTAVSLFAFIVAVFLAFGYALPGWFLARDAYLGLLIMLVSYTLVAIFRVRPPAGTSEPKGANSSSSLQPLDFSRILEAYFLDNVAKAKSVPVATIPYLLSLPLGLLAPMPKLDIEVPGFWMGLYVCTEDLKKFITSELKDNSNPPTGNVTDDFVNEFFDCNKTKGTEKWVGMQDLSPLGAFAKIAGYDGDGNKNSNKNIKGNENNKNSGGGNKILKIELQTPNLKIRKWETIRDDNVVNRGRGVAAKEGPAESREGNGKVVMVMKAWKGCYIEKELKIRHNPKRQRLNGRRVLETNVEERTRVKERKVFSIIIVGPRKYVEYLKTAIELRSRPATDENLLCNYDDAR